MTERDILKKRENEFEITKSNIEREFNDQKDALRDKSNLLEKQYQSRLAEEKARIKHRLIEESHKNLRDKLFEEEKELKNRLQKEFTQKMNICIEQQKMLSEKRALSRSVLIKTGR